MDMISATAKRQRKTPPAEAGEVQWDSINQTPKNMQNEIKSTAP